MEEMPVAPITPEDREFARIAGLFDAPAYIRRARGVEDALANLLARCRKKRASARVKSAPRSVSTNAELARSSSRATSATACACASSPYAAMKK